jgi:hypothetical protein
MPLFALVSQLTSCTQAKRDPVQFAQWKKYKKSRDYQIRAQVCCLFHVASQTIVARVLNRGIIHQVWGQAGG